MTRLAIIGDVHYMPGGSYESSLLFHRTGEILETAVKQIAAKSQWPDLVIQIGDLADHGGTTVEVGRRNLEEAMAVLDRSGLPWTWIPGNHDIESLGGHDALLPYLRRESADHEIEIDGDVLLLLDSACEKVYGRVEPGQELWLRSRVEKHRDRRVFVFMHHIFWWTAEDGMYTENGEALRGWMIGQPAIKAVFQGHVHTNRITEIEGFYEIATSALTSWPLMFRWVEIEEASVKTWTEKVNVAPEVEREAKDAWEANRHEWRGEMTEPDMKADLPLR